MKIVFRKILVLFLLLSAVTELNAINYPVFTAPDYVIYSDQVSVEIIVYDENGQKKELDTLLKLVVNDANRQLKIKNGSGTLILEGSPKIIRIENNQQELLFFKQVKQLPPILSILPPLVTILLAIIFQEVVIALIIGVLLGIFLIIGVFDPLNILRSPLVFVSDFLIRVLTDRDKISVIVFSLLIGGMVSLLIRNGSMKHLILKVSGYIKSKTKALFSVWFMGILIFFDDYANTLIVGNSMRPLSDKYKVSREKLAYIVDSTAAPVASVAFITTWIGAQLGFIDTALDHLSLDMSAYNVFLQSLPYSFYPLFTLFFIAVLIWKKRDYGPMYKAELLASGDFNKSLKNHQLNKVDDLKRASGRSRWYEAVVAVSVLVIVALFTLFSNPMATVIWDDPDMSTRFKLMEIISFGDSNKALLYASFSSLGIAFLMTLMRRKNLGLKKSVEAVIEGFKTMLIAMVILILAWTLAEVTNQLNTADYMSHIIRSNISPVILPAVIFLLSAIVAFSVGSSWGTMAVLYPVILPATYHSCVGSGMPVEEVMPIFFMAVSAVLGGSVMGDHCSPISDTTILSSMASHCDHIRHVKTQIPYSVTVGLISMTFGYLLAASLHISPLISLLAGFIIVYLTILLLGKKYN